MLGHDSQPGRHRVFPFLGCGEDRATTRGSCAQRPATIPAGFYGLHTAGLRARSCSRDPARPPRSTALHTPCRQPCVLLVLPHLKTNFLENAAYRSRCRHGPGHPARPQRGLAPGRPSKPPRYVTRRSPAGRADLWLALSRRGANRWLPARQRGAHLVSRPAAFTLFSGAAASGPPAPRRGRRPRRSTPHSYARQVTAARPTPRYLRPSPSSVCPAPPPPPCAEDDRLQVAVRGLGERTER